MKNNDPQVSLNTTQEKKFGYLVVFISAIFFLYQLFINSNFNLFLLILTIIFFLLNIFKPIFYKIPNLIWLKFAEIISFIVTPIILLFLFYLVITPVGLFARLFKNNELTQKIDKNKTTYWKKRKDNIGTMKNQF